MNTSPYTPMKEEIAFFFRKAYQVSFAYLVSVFGTLAGSKLEILADVARAFHTEVPVLVACAVLLLNTVYLTFTASCFFAVLKSAYFILADADASEGDLLARWESYVRVGRPPSRWLRWDVDYWYFYTFLAMVFAASIAVWLYASPKAVNTARWFLTLGLLLHAIPLTAYAQVWLIDKRCHRLANIFWERTMSEQADAGDGAGSVAPDARAILHRKPAGPAKASGSQHTET